MSHAVTAITTYVEQQLSLYPSWTVHSVYKKTVNIRSGEQLLALQAASSPMSPISMITDMDAQCFEELPVQPGQPVSFTGSRLLISSPERPVTFLYRPGKVLCTQLTSRGISLQRASHAGPPGRRRFTGRHIPAAVQRCPGRQRDKGRGRRPPHSDCGPKPYPPMQHMPGTGHVPDSGPKPGRAYRTWNRAYAKRR